MYQNRLSWTILYHASANRDNISVNEKATLRNHPIKMQGSGKKWIKEYGPILSYPVMKEKHKSRQVHKPKPNLMKLYIRRGSRKWRQLPCTVSPPRSNVGEIPRWWFLCRTTRRRNKYILQQFFIFYFVECWIRLSPLMSKESELVIWFSKT